MRHCWAELAALALMALAAALPAAGEGFDPQEALAISQGAIGRQLSDHRLSDRRSRSVALSDFHGRPLVISLVYTSCHHFCPVITRQLAEAAEAARSVLGADAFTVLTIGFDSPTDSPARMRVYAREQGVEASNWRFLSASPETVEALAGELGFAYFPSPRGFEHLAQVSVVDAAGRVYRQIYGDGFPPPALVKPLRDLIEDRLSEQGDLRGLLERVRLFCTVYDPATGAYRFDYSLPIAALVGVLCLGGVAVFIIRAWRENSARRSAPRIGAAAVRRR